MKTFKSFKEMLAYLRGKDQESKLKEVAPKAEPKEEKPKKKATNKKASKK